MMLTGPDPLAYCCCGTNGLKRILYIILRALSEKEGVLFKHTKRLVMLLSCPSIKELKVVHMVPSYLSHNNFVR